VMRKSFTDHCMHRILERKINIKRVHETVDNPDSKEDVFYEGAKRVRLTKKFEDGVKITVICEARPAKWWVITVWSEET